MSWEEALREITQAAAEHASQALTKLTVKPVTVEILNARVETVAELRQFYKQRDDFVAGVLLPITGDARGESLLVLDQDTVMLLCDVLLKRQSGTTTALSELEESMIKEVGNILTGSYLTVLGNRLQMKFIEHVPTLSCQAFGTVLKQVTDTLIGQSNKVLIMEVQFIVDVVTVKGQLVLFFALEAIDAMIRALEGRTESSR